MTLISVTIMILKPISPDAGRLPRFTQDTRGIPRRPKFRCRSLWPAQTSLPGREARTPEVDQRPESSAGFQLALMVPPGSVPFLRRGQPAMQRRLRWTQVDEQEHSASPGTPESGETARSEEHTSELQSHV